ncbi:MAG: fatty acid desaturase [candidate division KSB1 bacterium]|nr:fatty acid desaturase [candidate division KSB1 bacterium]
MAALILLCWAALLILLFSLRGKQTAAFALPGILLQTFLYTGVFITAHDAIHGSIVPRRHRLNSLIGALCLGLYALFPYRQVREKHFLHHRFPASSKDPDYHDGRRPSFFGWYFTFLRRYLSWNQLLGMAVIFNIFHHLFHVPTLNLMLFWVVPSLLSTLQLFFFGTFLPHREPVGGYRDRHRAVSSSLKPFWSLLACYHFDYHWEHHEYPSIPWWKLAIKRRETLYAAEAGRG